MKSNRRETGKRYTERQLKHVVLSFDGPLAFQVFIRKHIEWEISGKAEHMIYLELCVTYSTSTTRDLIQCPHKKFPNWHIYLKPEFLLCVGTCQ